MGQRRQQDRADRQLLRRLARGDVDALDTLYRRHGPSAWRQALWVTRRPADAEDVVQTVFVQLAGRGARLLGIASFRAYLGAAVHHEALRVLRRRHQEGIHPDVDPDSLLAPAVSPEMAAERAHLAEQLARLGDEQREVVLLRAHGGLSFREIGRAMGTSTFTAASRWRLALAHLRRHLGGQRS